MITATCNNCQASFNLKDELAGKKGKCPNCQSIFSIPEAIEAIPEGSQTPEISAEASHGTAHGRGIFKNHVYGVKQKRLAINEKYFIKDKENQDIFFSQRRMYFWRRFGAFMLGIIVFIGTFAVFIKLSQTLTNALALVWPIIAAILMIITIIMVSPKRHIEFFFSEKDIDHQDPEFVISQDTKIEFPTQTYTLRDGSGSTIAIFRKNIFTDILRKTWHMECSGKHVTIKEDSIILGLLRRWMPYGQFIRTNFIFVDTTHDQKSTDIIGYFKRKFELFDNYVLDMTKDPTYIVPRQFALCMAVLLDTAEKR